MFTSRFAQSGFSLLELMVVLGILSFLVASVGPMYGQVRSKATLDAATSTVADLARLAQVRAASSKNDTSWGLALSGTTLVVFSGSSFASRDQGLDLRESLPSGVSVSGLTEVVFAKLSGAPTAATSIVLSNVGGSKQVDVSAKGAVYY